MNTLITTFQGPSIPGCTFYERKQLFLILTKKIVIFVNCLRSESFFSFAKDVEKEWEMYAAIGSSANPKPTKTLKLLSRHVCMCLVL